MPHTANRYYVLTFLQLSTPPTPSPTRWPNSLASRLSDIGHVSTEAEPRPHPATILDPDIPHEPLKHYVVQRFSPFRAIRSSI